MARTATERRIIEKRNAKGILVPILEDILETDIRVEDEEDEQFMLDLMRARAMQREKGVFSPSMLGSCLRQAFFVKTEVTKRPSKSPRSNAFFLDGDFRHYKWQFALWKAHRAGKLRLLGVEVRVYHPNGDFAGTIDAIVEIDGEVFVIDFKGMNVNTFQQHEKWGTKDNYKVQIVGYAVIVNVSGQFGSMMGTYQGIDVKRCLLVGENKGGPSQQGSPIALHEDVLVVAEHRSKVKRRMATLRRMTKDAEVPAPECTSTRTLGFQECPFAYICRAEVLAIQKAKETPVSERSVASAQNGADTRRRSKSVSSSKRK